MDSVVNLMLSGRLRMTTVLGLVRVVVLAIVGRLCVLLVVVMYVRRVVVVVFL